MITLKESVTLTLPPFTVRQSLGQTRHGALVKTHLRASPKGKSSSTNLLASSMIVGGRVIPSGLILFTTVAIPKDVA